MTDPHADTHGQPATRRTICCPISREDEFSYRNPGVLGDTLIRTGRQTVEAARAGDEERTHRMLAYLADRISDAAALDDHTQRHLVESICSAITRDVQYALYERVNPPTEDPHDLEKDRFRDDHHDHGREHGSTRAPHGRIRNQHLRPSPVTPAAVDADTPDTTH
jgi:hypothetical protein